MKPEYAFLLFLLFCIFFVLMEGNDDVKALDSTQKMYAFDELSDELIALWEAADFETAGCGNVKYFVPVATIKALHALNAKAKEVLK